MKIGLRAGHSSNCRGARGIKDEYDCMIGLYSHIEKLLKQKGHTVVNCNSNASSPSNELAEGTNKANNNKCDVYVTLHMNAYNGSARGTEAWCYNANSGIANQIAKRFVNNMASFGTSNRGVKYNTAYHDLKRSSMPAVILETLFCDNREDMALWDRNSWDQLARVVANAIDPAIPLKEIAPPKPSTENKGDTYYRCICGSFRDRDNAEARKRELEAKGFTGVFLEAFKK